MPTEKLNHCDETAEKKKERLELSEARRFHEMYLPRDVPHVSIARTRVTLAQEEVLQEPREGTHELFSEAIMEFFPSCDAIFRSF